MQKLYFIAFLLTIARIRAILCENLHSKNKTKENVVMKKLYKIFLIGTMSLMLVACGNDEVNAAKTVEEETRVEETVEKPVTEETVTEEPATEESTVVEEKNMTEYQLTQMDTGFYGGIAWATVSSDAGTKHVLINKELQAVYELPEGMKAGDIFDGRAVVAYSDQSANPGFIILGADGNVLYECNDTLVQSEDYNISFTRDGSTIYEKIESGLAGNKVTAYILNSNFEKIAEMEIPTYYNADGRGAMEHRRYAYLTEGVYIGYTDAMSWAGKLWAWSLLKVNENMAVDLLQPGGYTCVSAIGIDCGTDRCAGLNAFVDLDLGIWIGLMGDAVDYNGISDANALCDFIRSNGKEYYDSETEFNHGYIMYTKQEYDRSAGDYRDNITSIDGFTLPDFGAPIDKFWLSDDGRYASLSLEGADGNTYTTVIGNDGQKLYEPVVAEELYHNRCVCDGYILTVKGEGLTPEGKEFKLGDGTALTGIGENSTAYIQDNNQRHFRLSDGYIVCQNKLYSLDGTEVTTVTAVN